MEAYKFQTKVDENKIFVVKRSEIENRIDPVFYKKEYRILKAHFLKNNFIKIGTIIKSWNRGDGPREGYYTQDKINGVPFLRINNLKENSITLKGVKYINRHIHNTKLKRTQVQSGDLIFAISGTKDNLGTVSIIPENIFEANLNSALVRLNINESIISKDFFCVLFHLPFIRTQIEFIGKGAAQNNLNNDEIASIFIPNFSLLQQQKIVNLYQEAYQIKQEKEQEAKDLLASIDTYLLDELGITLPKKETSLESRIFTTQLSEISGDRFDSEYYTNYNKNLIKAIEKSTYPIEKIKEQCTFVSGYAFSSSDYITISNCLLITIKNISKNSISIKHTTYLPNCKVSPRCSLFFLF